MQPPTPRQQGSHAAHRLIVGVIRAAIEQRGSSVAADLVHELVGDLVRLAMSGKIEAYNEQLDGVADALGEYLYAVNYEDEPSSG